MPSFETWNEMDKNPMSFTTLEEFTDLPRVPMRTSATLVCVSKVAAASTTVRLALLADTAPLDCTKLKLCPRNDDSFSPTCAPLPCCRIATVPLTARFSMVAAAGESAAPLRRSAEECITVKAAMATDELAVLPC